MLSQQSPILSLTGWLVMILSLGIVGTSCQSVPATSRENAVGSIYYESMNSLWRMEYPNGAPVRLADNVIDSPLNLSPNQKWLAYTVNNLQVNQKLMSIWIVGTKGGQAVKVSNDVPLAQYTWTDDNQLMVNEYPDFHVEQDTGRPVWGQSITYEFNPETRERNLSPSLAPITDHSRCRVFLAPGQIRDMAERCGSEMSDSFLRVVRLDGSNPITLAIPYKGGDVAWSVDGGKLAFQNMDDSGNSQLFIWDKKTNDVKRFTLGKADFIAPSWSPDGKWVAFQSGGNDLCVTQTNIGEVKCFHGYVSALGVPPAWSPDSRAIVLASNRIGELALGEATSDWDLFAIGIPGGEVTRITHDANMESWPIWGQ